MSFNRNTLLAFALIVIIGAMSIAAGHNTKPATRATYPSADFLSTTITDVPQSDIWNATKELRSDGYTLFSYSFEEDGQVTIRAVGGLIGEPIP
jgi:hypothetical protein